MKTRSTGAKKNVVRIAFCLVLALTLAAAVFALGGSAANSDPTLYDVKVVSCSSHTAALSKGNLYMWGLNDYGQFSGTAKDYSPKPIKTLSNVKDVAVAYHRTLIVTQDGKLLQCGRDPLTGEVSPASGTVLLESGVAQAAACENLSACVTDTGDLYVWGAGNYGQIGNGEKLDVQAPVKVLEDVSQVSLGSTFVTALKKDGTLWGWGSNDLMQLGLSSNGNPSPTSVSTPRKILDDVVYVSDGPLHTCAIKKDGSLWTAGATVSCQTGVVSEKGYTGFVKVLDNVRAVSAGTRQTAAIGTDGKVYLCGTGYDGTAESTLDTRTSSLTATDFDYVQVFVCDGSLFGVKPDGAVYAMGDNNNYRLGKEDGSNAPVAVQIFDANMKWVYDSESDPNLHPFPVVPAEKTLPEQVGSAFLNGYDDGTIRPDKPVTRAQFLKMLILGVCEDFDPNASYGASTFSDVSSKDWFASYAAYAQLNGIANGYDDGTLHPNINITRAEAAKFTALALKLTIDEEKTLSASFNDVRGWATPYVDVLAQRKILGGYGDGTFLPNKEITRAEAAKIVAAAKGFEPSDTAVSSMRETYLNPFADVADSKWYYGYLLYAAGYMK